MNLNKNVFIDLEMTALVVEDKCEPIEYFNSPEKLNIPCLNYVPHHKLWWEQFASCGLSCVLRVIVQFIIHSTCGHIIRYSQWHSIMVVLFNLDNKRFNWGTNKPVFSDFALIFSCVLILDNWFSSWSFDNIMEILF